MKTLTRVAPLVVAAGSLLPAIAQAQEIDTGDTAWLLTSTALVLFMTLPGLALFYGGLVRTKNVLSVLMQCFAICCAISIVWLVYGYSLAFGSTAGGGIVGDFSRAWLAGVGLDTPSGTIPESVFVMFQLTFAIITPALIVGGFAERMRFSAMLLFSILWATVVYFPVTHWVWNAEGWLYAMDFRDFAGGAVVHVNAGVAALVAALVLKNRRGFPSEPMPPHNLTMTVAGASMLWVGWFGFNGGSALAAGGAAGMAILVTHISAAAGSLAWMGMEWIRFGKPSVLGIVTGMVAGLGTITPASGFVGPAGALVIGLIAGVVCFLATQFIKRTLKIDDSLDVFPVHGVGGFLGLLLTAPLSLYLGGLGLPDGQSVGGQFMVQLIGAGATIVWCGVATFVLLKLVGIVAPLRAPEDDERQGLDLTQHDERGYNL
ncbi:MAG: ammonium transporter [Gammaproteobacteria bacterium]|nr:ammonium transporter [Gammaproteobacteria bacterium]